MRWSVERKVVTGAGIALAILLINALVSYRATRTLIDEERWITHTYKVLAELEATLSTMKDAETGERGFIITGDESYLDPYYAALDQIQERMESLRQLTADNADHQARLPALESKINARLERLKLGVDLRRAGNLDIARGVIRTGVGKGLMDSLREDVGAMEAEENALLKARLDESKASARYAFLTDVIPNFFACAFLSLVSFVVIRDITERKRLAEALRVQREWLQVTLSSIGDAVIATDTEGSVNFMNSVAESLTGWDAQNAQGQPLEKIFRIVNEQTQKQVENPALRAIRDGSIIGLANHTLLIARDGTELPIDDSGAPIRDSNGKTIGAVLVFRDVTERRNADRASALLAGIVESSQDAIISKNLNGIILSWNAGAERIFEYSASEVIGQSITILIPQDRLSEEQVILDRISRGESVEHFETVRVSRSGRLIDISLTISPLRDITGRIIGASKIARDITEQRRSRQELFESRERLRMAMQAGQMGTWARHLDESNRVQWSPELEEIFGFESGQFPETEEAFFDLVHPDDRERVQQSVATAIQDRNDYEVEFRYTRKGEGLRWMIGRGRAFYDSSGTPRRLAGLGWDITERKRAEEALRQQREWFRTTLSSIGDAVIATDTQGAVTFLNDVAQSLTGWKQEEAENRPLSEVFKVADEKTGKPVENPALRAMKEGTVVSFTDDSVLIARDGAEIPIDDSGAPIKDSEGNLLGAVLIFRDITDRRRAEQDRFQLLSSERSAREQAEAASRAKDEFVAMVSHEIRSPLNAMLGWAQMLRTGKLDQQQTARAIETIERNAKDQAKLVEDLLDISRVVSGKLLLSVRPVDAAQIMEAAIDSIRPAAEAKSIDLQLHLSPQACLLSGDPDRLQQVVWNLLSNAVKFTPRGGKVEARVERVDANMQITVSDSGAGISPEFLPYVFDRFTQANMTTERKHGGLGLGLAIVRHLVELHGGAVRAESAGSGRGATFTVTLPVSVVSARANETELSKAANPALSLGDTLMFTELKVMIVDDEAEARDLLSAILTQRGAEVRTYASAAEALEAVKDWRPSVIVSDIGMPGEDGYGFIRKLRMLGPERGGNVPAVALTAYARSEDRMRVLAAGFQMHVPKPVEAIELIMVIASLADRRAMKA
jgi:PAS domain S-box-containing protein